MKVGTSFSRCVRDIYNGDVDIYDVMVVVARTDVDPSDDAQWASIWNGYVHGGLSHPEWRDLSSDEAGVREICINLQKLGKLHQPRKFGAFPMRHNEYWYDCVLTAETLSDRPAVKKAWDNYKLIAGLS